MKNRKTLASILAAVLAAIMLLSLIASVLPRPVEAASSSEIKKQLDALKEERDELNNQLSGLKSQYNDNLNEMKDIVAQKQLLDQEIFLLHEQVNKTNEMIATYNVLIADLQEDLNDAEDRLATLNEQYKERIRAMEEDGSLSYWSVLFKASSFSDLLDRLSMVQEIAAADRRRLQELQAAAQEVAAAQEALNEEKKALEEVKEQLALTQADLQVRQNEAVVLLDQLITKGEEFEALSDEGEDAQNALQDEIAKTEKEYKNQKYKEWLATSVPPTTKPPKPTGGSDGNGPVSSSSWRSPLTKSSWVTSPFGMRVHPVTGKYKMHNGVDLAASKGDQIVAVRSGVVSRATYDSGGGWYVVVNHGDGFSSVYMHMTHYVVSAGQTVSAGQLLGYVGSTGVSTGPHLHFAITYNGSYVNPCNYVRF